MADIDSDTSPSEPEIKVTLPTSISTVSSVQQFGVTPLAHLFVHLHVEPVGHLVVLKRVEKNVR